MFAEDLAPFFSTADFAVTASAYTVLGVYTEFAVQMDRGYVQAGMVGDTAPTATCKTADVAGVVWDSGITIDGISYSVATVRPDGTGVTTLTLRED